MFFVKRIFVVISKKENKRLKDSRESLHQESIERKFQLSNLSYRNFNTVLNLINVKCDSITIQCDGEDIGRWSWINTTATFCYFTLKAFTVRESIFVRDRIYRI